MKLLRYFAAILAIAVLSCKPENLPEETNNNGKPDVENPEGGETDEPGTPDEGDNSEEGEGENPGTTDPDTPTTPEPEPEPEQPQEPQESYYVEVAQTLSDWSGDYLITYTSNSSVLVLNSYSDTKGYGVEIGSSLTSQGIHSSTGDQYKAVVTKSGSGYTINVTGIGYLGLDSGKNSVNASSSDPSSDNYRWTFSYKDGGSVWVKNVGHSNYRLQWNASANIFRCYTGSQKELTLYRRGISTGGTPGTNPDPTPDPTPDPEPDPTPDPTPDPEPDPDEPGDIPTPAPGQSGKYGWYELPVINYSIQTSFVLFGGNSCASSSPVPYA